MAKDRDAVKQNSARGSAFTRLVERLGRGVSAAMARLGTAGLEHLPLLNRLTRDQRQPALVTVLVASVLLAAAFLVWYIIQVGNRAEYIEIATRLQMLSQRYAKNAQQAVLGNAKAFAQLDEARLAFADGLNTLIDGGAGVPASPGALQGDLAALKKRWEVSRKDIETLIGQQATLVGLGQAMAQISLLNTELEDLTEQAAALLPDGSRQWAYANQQSLWTQRMAKNANALLSADVIDPETAYQLAQDTRTFRQVLDAMLQGSTDLDVAAVSDADARDKLLELQEVFIGFEAQVNNVLKSMAPLVEAKLAARELFDESEQLLAMTQALTQRYQATGAGITLSVTVVFALIALASMLALAMHNVQEAQRRAQEAAQENRRNQDAIMRLLNEMGDLAEGDLTVQATVTEDITGAIADSVNYAIEELRVLVQGINRAAEQVAVSASQARANAEELLKASEVQAQLTSESTQAVNQMSRSIVQVSENAAASTSVAAQSLITARRGGDAVRDAIAGMSLIRDQIQETAKRIKRLGESSQEIGEIVELIGDITEQTNVLALNAAIQAAAAGEAGRGFSVVAEEVQRLAERSANATRRIGAIVKAIQGDTQDAVNAMEGSTQGVVGGTALSDAAGHALQEIESVSAQLARLIQDISAATHDQARTAEDIAQNMQEILQVTQQASDGARRSVQSLSQLTALAEELKVSVSGFKL